VQPVDGAPIQVCDLPAAHPEDAFVAAHPQVAELIVEDAKHRVVEQTVRRGVDGEMPISKAGESSAVRADPERTVRVFVERIDHVRGETVLRGVARHSLAPDAKQPATIAGDPGVSGSAPQDVVHRGVSQSLSARGGPDDSIL